MTLFRPLFMQPAVGDEFEYSANELRNFWGLLFNAEGVANTNGPATFANNDLKVSQRGAGANMSVDVLGGLAVILGDDVTFQGFYVCFSSATENLVVPAPPASGSRIHRVIARVKDKLHEASWSTYEWTLEVLEDTDGSGPPTLPDSAISLATVTVSAGDPAVTDSAIADTRRSAVMGSGMTAGRNVSSDALRPANPHESEIVWRTDGKLYEVWDGANWLVLGPPPAPKQVESTTTIAAFTNSSYAAGTPACGDTFKAPSTGRVYITVSGRLSSASNGQQSFLSYEVRTGTTVGSGTVAQAASDDRALVTSRAVNTGAASYTAGSRRVLLEGLTGGADYNVRTMHKVTGGQGTCDFRALLIEPA